MTVIQTSAEQKTPGEFRCPYCNNALPAYATFCGACGKKLEQGAQTAAIENSAERYRITALVGRHPYIQLFLAMDTLFKRPVTMCEITVSSLNAEDRSQAFEAIQQEYEQLRYMRIPGLTPIIDLRITPEHATIVGGWPFPLPEIHSEGTLRTHTLEGILQSGTGLPSELVALTWIHRLCNIVGQLHRSSIVIGTIDPASIVVSNDAYMGQPALMVSWLPQQIRLLLSSTDEANLRDESHFSAPETTQNFPEPRSDLYSLGALLYLLLTGTPPPSEAFWLRTATQRLRERSPHLSRGTEELVLRALSHNPSERFANADEMSEALQKLITSITLKRQAARGYPQTIGEHEESAEEFYADVATTSETSEATVSVVPIRAQLARWHLSLQDTRDMSSDIQAISAHASIAKLEQAEEATNGDATQAATSNEILARGEAMPVTPIANLSLETPQPPPETSDESQPGQSKPTSLSQSLRQRITGILPPFPRRTQPRIPATQADLDASTKPAVLAWLQRFVIGEQQQRTTAAALIEMPLRVQPNQGYTIRIHLMGRDSPTATKGTKKGAQPVGLSALKKDEIVHIEVRSAIYQNYAYVVQRADVQLPGAGFAAEVTIPMQPLSSGQSGRRERLHIFFMDELRQPLYERPFVIEVMISHLVQSGKEGHSVMSIPV